MYALDLVVVVYCMCRSAFYVFYYQLKMFVTYTPRPDRMWNVFIATICTIYQSITKYMNRLDRYVDR